MSLLVRYRSYFSLIFMPRSPMIVTLHKYNKNDNYHKQCHVHTLQKAYCKIKSHDEYILVK
ncbi:hypothetical protein acsn021_21370 [Anaerocolumna cellulosilytica]|uniref:Uncharacterized protein n=1 Tax=Anaerocolumna cellulosilytica TaxID=433286 RepID=A0A6S6R6C2_9FIRM|nr:hypothetical protein acsn021_21370 [Anaerocolumna cellulosilytica]